MDLGTDSPDAPITHQIRGDVIIQSVNGINRIYFYKAILLVEIQPLEFIVVIGSPVTIIPPIFIAKEIQETAKRFVDVKQIPIKFRGEAMVEVKTEKGKETLPIIITEVKIPNHYWD